MMPSAQPAALTPAQVTAWARDAQPVFVVGPERSGTSILFRTITELPEYMEFPTLTAETAVFKQPRRLLRLERCYELGHYLDGEEGWAQLEAIIPALVSDVTDPRSAEMDQVIRAFFCISSRRHAGLRLIEKTPAHLWHIPRIVRCFRQSRVLVCTRNPVDIVASHRRRLEKEIEAGKSSDDPSLAWLAASVAEFAQLLQRAAQTVNNALANYPDNCLVVSYERFTERDPELVRALERFLGVQIRFSEGSRSIKDSPWDPLLGAPVTKNIPYADRYLSPDEQRELRQALKGLGEEWCMG